MITKNPEMSGENIVTIRWVSAEMFQSSGGLQADERPNDPEAAAALHWVFESTHSSGNDDS